MTAATKRLAKLVRIRDRQQVAAQARLGRAQAELTAIDGTIERVATLRGEFALDRSHATGQHINALGELGGRLDSLEALLASRRGMAAGQHQAAVLMRLAAWQDCCAAMSLHDRATAADAKACDAKASAQPRPRQVRTRSGKR
jgi:hypothetical protein